MDIDAVNRIMREGPAISGGYLQVDTSANKSLYRELKTTPGVASVTLSNVARRSFEDTLASVINTVTGGRDHRHPRATRRCPSQGVRTE
jgi:putative ABC transport system permease protein